MDHILAHIKGDPYRREGYGYSLADRDSVVIKRNRLHEHRTIRFKSTTYDTRRLEESANPRTHADVLVNSSSYEGGREVRTPCPYWHARIVGIYHLDLQMRTESTTALSPERRMNILFVRWFKISSTDGDSGWRARRLHKIKFLPEDDSEGHVFGFLDPNEVIRMVHTIPDFSSDRTKELWVNPLTSVARWAHPDGEYPIYYVAM